MKKIFLTAMLLCGITVSTNAAGVELPPSIGGIQGTEFQMKLMEQQRFRREEYNEYKDMKTQKEERNKKLNLQKNFSETQQIKPVNQPPEVNIIKENGQIKLVPVK